MTERYRPAIHVELVVIDAKVSHEFHWNNRKRLIDLKEVMSASVIDALSSTFLLHPLEHEIIPLSGPQLQLLFWREA